MTLRAVSSGAASAVAAVNVTDGTTIIAAPGTIQFEGATVRSESGTAVVELGGFAKIYKKRINFDDADLVAGVEIYTPSVGEVLVDAWARVVITFDGTTPTADIGTFVGSTIGLFGGVPWNLSLAYNEDQGAGVALTAQGSFVLAYGAQAVFTATNPLKVCISQTGATDGTPIDSTQGIVDAYFIVATPVDVDG